jgi:DNA-directed RNA polymerase specialized sigma24 family protein
MAFALHEIQGLSNEDIAAVMQCPVNTVRSRRILAVRKLRESLERLHT